MRDDLAAAEQLFREQSKFDLWDLQCTVRDLDVAFLCIVDNVGEDCRSALEGSVELADEGGHGSRRHRAVLCNDHVNEF